MPGLRAPRRQPMPPVRRPRAHRRLARMAHPTRRRPASGTRPRAREDRQRRMTATIARAHREKTGPPLPWKPCKTPAKEGPMTNDTRTPAGGYAKFLASKQRAARTAGRPISSAEVSPLLHPWQQRIVTWAVRTGRAAIWADTGLGKTWIQLE